MNDSDHDLRESADKARIETKIKRGSGARDQDSYKIKVRGIDEEEVARRLEVTIFELQCRGVFEEIRQLQPDREEGYGK